MSDLIPFDTTALALSSTEEEKYRDLAALMSGQREGFEDSGADWRPAVLKIVQPVTLDAAKPDTAKNGDLFHKGGGVQNPMRVVLAYAWTSRVRFVNGVDKRPSCSSENVDLRGRGAQDKSVSIYGDSCAKCPHGDQPFTAGKMTNCNNVLNVILIPESLENVYQYSFSRSGYTIGKQFTDLARATPNAWSRFYSFGTEAKKRERGGLYYVPSITPVSSPPVPEHLKAFARYVYQRISDVRAEVKQMIVQRPGDSDVSNVVTVDETGTPDFKDAI